MRRPDQDQGIVSRINKIEWLLNLCGGSKPPPYGTSIARFAPSIMTPTVRMGLGPSAINGYPLKHL